MPTTVQVVNRYVSSDNVASAAIVFDGAAIDAHSPRTRANGQVAVATETLSDGDHVMHIVPNPTAVASVGPPVAEGLAAANDPNVPFAGRHRHRHQGQNHGHKRAAQSGLNGSVLGTNPVRVQLQPIYFRSPFPNASDRAGTDITLIVLHHTSGAANIGGTLEWYVNPATQTSATMWLAPRRFPRWSRSFRIRAVRGRRDTTRPGKAIRPSIISRSASSCPTKPARPSRTSSSTRCWSSSIEYGRPIRRFRRMESSDICTCCWRTRRKSCPDGIVPASTSNGLCWRNADLA